jgi:transcriptional regulator with XRE-family HTH domain
MYLDRLVIDNIKRIRKEKGISQEKLAEACNTATSYIGLMETYRNIPKLSTIERIAGALDVDPLVLFHDPARVTSDDEPALRQRKNKILAIVDRELDAILHEQW